MNQTQRKAEGAEKNFERKTNSICQANLQFFFSYIRVAQSLSKPFFNNWTSSVLCHINSIFKIFLPNITVLRSKGLRL